MKAVKRKISEDLISSFDLRNLGTDNKPVFQFVYASQLYGTLFALYGRFDCKISDGSCSIKGLKLRLVNYQGIINLGFTNDAPIFDGSPDKGDIYFAVRGLSKKNEVTLKFKTPILIEKGTSYRITFKRILYPIVGNPPKYALGTDYSNPAGNAFDDNEYFDSEFFGRNGVDKFRNPLRPGMANFDNVTMAELRKKGVGLGSPRCHEGIVSLFF